jgi:hypothetical protein
MIYECPSCRTPQEAGQTICSHCHAQFDGPVPSDAIIPATSEPELPSAIEAKPITETDPTAETSVAPTEPISGEPILEAQVQAAESEAQTEDAAPPLVEVPPPITPKPEPASNSQPYLTAPTYSPSAFTAPETASSSLTPPSKLARPLLIAFPLILLLVLGSIFYANSLNTGSDTLPMPPPAPVTHASVPIAPAPITSPTVLQGAGNTNNTSDDPRAKMLAGHWVAPSGNFYVFNSDGTGSRGNPVKQQQEQTFLWGLVQNRLMLYMNQNETLRFNAGPDDNTIFLGAQTGHYIQFTRSKTS